LTKILKFLTQKQTSVENKNKTAENVDVLIYCWSIEGYFICLFGWNKL